MEEALMRMARRPQTLPYKSRLADRLSSLALAGFLSACSQNALETASTQRELGEATLSGRDLSVTVTSGVVRAIDAEGGTMRLRLSAGVGRVTLRAGPRAQGAVRLTLENVHPEAVARVRVARTLSATECEGDLSVQCAQDPDNAFCRSVLGARPTQAPDQIVLRANLRVCQETVVDVRLPDERAQDDVSFVVIGAAQGPETLKAIVERERDSGGAHDFYLLLGDALTQDTPGAVAELDRVAQELGEVVVALPGEQEMAEDNGASFEQRFGGFDYSWSMKGVQFVTFYSAEAELSARGLGALKSLLRALEDDDLRWRQTRSYAMPAGDTRALPLFAFTHTPPLDPRGLREGGFVSRPQGAMVLSLLAEYAVHTLFAGRLSRNGERDSRPRLHVVASQDTRVSRDEGEYLVVTLSSQPREGFKRVNNRHMRVSTRDLP